MVNIPVSESGWMEFVEVLSDDVIIEVRQAYQSLQAILEVQGCADDSSQRSNTNYEVFFPKFVPTV